MKEDRAKFINQLIEIGFRRGYMNVYYTDFNGVRFSVALGLGGKSNLLIFNYSVTILDIYKNDEEVIDRIEGIRNFLTPKTNEDK